MKIVHAADLHIDSPLRGLERYEGAPYERVRAATREAFRNVIALCLRERARFLVLAGDVFDGDWKDMNTGMFFLRELHRLREIACEVILLRGNHDFELTRALTYPEHVHEFGGVRGTRTFAFDSDGVAFHGVSYMTKQVKETLLPSYPAPLPLLNVGVMHTNATGNSEHAAYAPCTVSDLVAHGYQYWALGHVHAHAILSTAPYVVYPGNTQGRSVRETGPKGCVLIECDDQIREVRFVETSVMRWVSEVVTLKREDDRETLLEKVRARLREVEAREGQLTAVRLRVTGGCRAHADVCRDHERLLKQLRADAMESSSELWLEKIELATTPATSLRQLREAKGLVADLLQHVDRVRKDEGNAELHHVARALEPLKKKLGAQLAEAGVNLDDDDTLARLLAGAEALLAERLTEGASE